MILGSVGRGVNRRWHHHRLEIVLDIVKRVRDVVDQDVEGNLRPEFRVKIRDSAC